MRKAWAACLALIVAGVSVASTVGVPTASADTITTNQAQRIVSAYKGTWTDRTPHTEHLKYAQPPTHPANPALKLNGFYVVNSAQSLQIFRIDGFHVVNFSQFSSVEHIWENYLHVFHLD